MPTAYGNGNNVKLTIEEMRKIARKRGGACLSKEYKNARSKLRWRCAVGHEWEAIPDSVKRGTWCPHCAGKLPHKIEMMQEIAQKRGGACLSKEYKNAHTKLRWRCAEGHEWEALPLNVYNHGKWCAVCANHVPLTIEEMHELAARRGGMCLSGVYKNNETKLRWRCAKGHEWEATPANVKNGKWCLVCAGKALLTIEEMHELAAAKGGRCLSKEYQNNHTKLRWRCAFGHEWEARPSDIKGGKWCGQCYCDYRKGSLKKLKVTTLPIHPF